MSTFPQNKSIESIIIILELDRQKHLQLSSQTPCTLHGSILEEVIEIGYHIYCRGLMPSPKETPKNFTYRTRKE